MREIKFRVPVFSHLTTKFLRFEYWRASHLCFSCDSPNIKSNDDVYGDDEQFIGLHDKNGKEIYENDICKIRFDIDKVEDYIYASLTEKEIRTCERVFVVESPLFNNQPELNADIIEIIGNIHENPELLND